MERIDAAERPGQGVFGLCGRHRRRLSVDDLCRPASCRRAWGRARSDKQPSSDIHPCTISLRRRGRKLEELAVAERAGAVAEVQINRRPKARPSIVRDARERRVTLFGRRGRSSSLWGKTKAGPSVLGMPGPPSRFGGNASCVFDTLGRDLLPMCQARRRVAFLGLGGEARVGQGKRDNGQCNFDHCVRYTTCRLSCELCLASIARRPLAQIGRTIFRRSAWRRSRPTGAAPEAWRRCIRGCSASRSLEL